MNTLSYRSLFACLQVEVLEQPYHNQFHHQKSKSHPNAIAGSNSKGQVSVWINTLLILFAEPSVIKTQGCLFSNHLLDEYSTTP